MKLRIVLKKEVQDEAEGQQLYDQLKTLIEPAEPITKDAQVIENIPIM